jgi:hypothetical protein
MTAIALMLLALLILKPIQVYLERSEHNTSVLAEGLTRRLDDPSFWAVFASLLAATLIRQASRCLMSPNEHRPPTRLAPVYPIVWASTAVAGLVIYIFSSYVNHEVWFDESKEPSVHVIQVAVLPSLTY